MSLITNMNLGFTKSNTDCGCGSKNLNLSNTIKTAKNIRKSHRARNYKKSRKSLKSKHT
jgi:hypothetical protein